MKKIELRKELASDGIGNVNLMRLLVGSGCEGKPL